MIVATNQRKFNAFFSDIGKRSLFSTEIYGPGATPLWFLLLNHTLKLQANYKVGELMCHSAQEGAELQEQLFTCLMQQESDRSPSSVLLSGTNLRCAWIESMTKGEQVCASHVENKSLLPAQPLGNCHPGRWLSWMEQAAGKGPL